MTQPDPLDASREEGEGDPWVAFVRHHRPTPPPPAPELEDRILAAIAQEGIPHPKRRWGLPALAAAMLVVLGGGGWWLLRSPTPQLAQGNEETFLIEVWYDTAYGDDTLRLALNTAEPDWLLSVYATPY